MLVSSDIVARCQQSSKAAKQHHRSPAAVCQVLSAARPCTPAQPLQTHIIILTAPLQPQVLCSKPFKPQQQKHGAAAAARRPPQPTAAARRPPQTTPASCVGTCVYTCLYACVLTRAPHAPQRPARQLPAARVQAPLPRARQVQRGRNLLALLQACKRQAVVAQGVTNWCRARVSPRRCRPRVHNTTSSGAGQQVRRVCMCMCIWAAAVSATHLHAHLDSNPQRTPHHLLYLLLINHSLPSIPYCPPHSFPSMPLQARRHHLACTRRHALCRRRAHPLAPAPPRRRPAALRHLA